VDREVQHAAVDCRVCGECTQRNRQKHHQPDRDEFGVTRLIERRADAAPDPGGRLGDGHHVAQCRQERCECEPTRSEGRGRVLDRTDSQDRDDSETEKKQRRRDRPRGPDVQAPLQCVGKRERQVAHESKRQTREPDHRRRPDDHQVRIGQHDRKHREYRDEDSVEASARPADRTQREDKRHDEQIGSDVRQQVPLLKVDEVCGVCRKYRRIGILERKRASDGPWRPGDDPQQCRHCEENDHVTESRLIPETARERYFI